jgi:endonuclease YncB( thermonuclease family)
MPEVKIFWDPQGLAIDSLGTKEFLRATDGDTPYVSMSVRMLSIDAPETHYPGRSRPSNSDGDLEKLAEWIYQGQAPIDDKLAAYLYPRLQTGQAGTLQEHQGKQAAAMFEDLLEKRLSRESGTRRSLYVSTADQPFDQYGRLLAYIAPSYSSEERDTLSVWERASFNLLMVRSGWAATLIIYPSIPKYHDLVLFRDAAKEAYMTGLGAWAEPNLLTGYEFRMVVKLHKVTKRLVDGEKLSSSARKSWIERYCVDMTTQQIYYPEHYYRVAPYDRLFIWPKDVAQAVAQLNLLPAD